MEIFRLFNPEWPVGSPKNSTKCNSCEALSKQLQDKHEVLLTLINKGNEVQKQLQESQEKEMEMQTTIDQLKDTNDEILKVLEQYERIMNELIINRNACKTDSDTALHHLSNLENSFSDVHSKYERVKQSLEGYRHNEILLLESIKDNERTIMDLQNKFEILKENSILKLEEANKTVHNMERQHKDEIQRYKTRVKKLELSVNCLETSLSQKTKENHHLSSICDEFTKYS